MDLLTHIASGAAAGTLVAAFACGKGARPLQRLAPVGAGALGGALPDIDAISLWSGFDATFGRLFALEQSGAEIYGGKLWYSHHAFFHSLAGAVAVLALLGLAGWGIHRWRGRPGSFFAWARSQAAPGVALVAGYLAHLAGDLPTPASVWGGIALFWPSGHYVGGTGKIWWWNSYDLFLLVFSCALLNTLLLLTLRKTATRRRTIACMSVLALGLIVIQLNTRQTDYAYRGHTARYALLEERSKAEQRRILGERFYRTMEWFDRKLPLHF